ncbi:MAG: RDD family protein [Methanomassiliicoccales archaeon]|nr:RDD family protein [Methanomassiliicoccales archaeon]
MPIGYELLEQSGDFRRHWLKRVAAGLIDGAIVAVPISLALGAVSSMEAALLAGVFSGIGLFAYSAVLEGWFGQTIGKKLLRLRVVSLGDKGRFYQAAIRSVPKLFWYAFLPIDVFAGLAAEGDPRQRWSDHAANTTVVAYRPSTIHVKKKRMADSAPVGEITTK